MKTTVNVYDFRDAFYRMGRGDQFSYEGLRVLFEYLEECERDLGEEHELDVIALCCDFAESEARAIAEDYRIDTRGMNDSEVFEAVKDYLIDEGTYVDETIDSIIYRQF